MSVRVRFAPSPTGYLHIGGARTALFNWLFAKHHKGVFILRIEDTDTARNTQEAVEVILNGLKWLGIEWDEGPLSPDPAGPYKGDFGPYFQSQRRKIYETRVQELLSKGMAYEHEGAIKFRMTREPVEIDDIVVGKVVRTLTDREAEDPDFVIIRSDGHPVFHFVNVIDDMEMRITHVIRGEDHLSNTAKHIALFRAFGVEPPKYAHIPLILNQDGSKMSKRDTGASMTTYMEEGYVPEAVLNYLCLLGWSPKNNREVMPVEEIIAIFDLPQILRHNARFDMDKLKWINYEYTRLMSQQRFYELSIQALKKAAVNLDKYPEQYIKSALDTCRGKVKLFSELPSYAGFYFKDDVVYDPEAAKQHFIQDNKPMVSRLKDVLASLPEFTATNIESAMKSVASELGVKVGKIVHPIRLACTGATAGPSLYHLMEVIGKEKVLERLDKALNLMN
ncbi:MAG: glutamate--tRNA ligase [Verrucomicrobiae bacterium]|nr:glutamate--tRNA ligase [Verrucomicrobiae bacterium]